MSLPFTNNGNRFRRLPKKAAFSPAQPRRAKTRRSAGKAAAGTNMLFTSYASRFTAAGSAARTPLADFFSSLLGGLRGS